MIYIHLSTFGFTLHPCEAWISWTLLFCKFGKTILLRSAELERKQMNKFQIGTLHLAQFIGKMDWSLFFNKFKLNIIQIKHRPRGCLPLNFSNWFNEICIFFFFLLEKCILFSSLEISYKYGAYQPTEHLIQDENDLFACKHEDRMEKSVAKQCRNDRKKMSGCYGLLLLIQLTG